MKTSGGDATISLDLRVRRAQEATDRERFCLAVGAGPILPGEAIVVLCGEDADARVQVASGLFQQHAALNVPAPILVLTGGRDDPPRWKGAERMMAVAMGLGIPHDAIMVDTDTSNTHDQAVNVVALCEEHEWGRILLVASPYHQYRAYLTFVKELKRKGMDEQVHILSIPASQAQWRDPPPGMDTPRIDILHDELRKCGEYAEHVATYAEGLDYLLGWEERTRRFAEAA